MVLDRLRNWLISRVTETHTIRGFRIIVENTRDDIATPDVLARLDEALVLIETHQPWRLRHLRRDVAEFWVKRYPCRGAYFGAHRAIMTELTFLARRDITAATVASSIVHEGIHARVDRMCLHLAATGERDRAHEERLCRKAELAFGESLPVSLGAPVIERALQSLALADDEVAPEIDWRVAQARQEAIDAEARRR